MTKVLRELYGQWWLTDDPSVHVMGRLVIEVDGSTHLDLSGSLIGFTETASVLWGVAEGIPITLMHCFSLQMRGLGPGPGGSFQSLHVRRAFVGAQFRPEDAVFNSARVELENLTGFLAAPVVDRMVEEDHHGYVASVTGYLTEASFEDWTITARSHANTFGYVETRAGATVSATVTPYLHLTPPVPVPAAEFDGLILHLSDLLTLASGEACGLISATLTVATLPTAVEEPDESEALERFVSMPVTVDVYGRRTHTASPDSPGVTYGEFRFTCADLAFEDVIPAWLGIRHDAETACNVFFGMQYARPGYTETRLLLSAIAAEGFHTAFSETTTSMPEEQFKTLRAKILDAMENEKEREWVETVLSNRVSFRRRLRGLARIPDRVARSMVVRHPEAWAGDVVAARNTLAHTGNHTHDTDPFTLERMTTGLLTLVLMERLGMDPDTQRRAAHLLAVRE